MFNKLLLIVGCIGVSLVAGCTTTPPSVGNKFDESKIQNIKTGTSTKEDVLSLVGTPFGKTSSADGQSIWTYQFGTAAVHQNAASFIPVVQFVASKATLEKHDQYLTVVFNKTGVVASCMYRISSYTYVEGARQGESKETKCEDVVSPPQP